MELTVILRLYIMLGKWKVIITKKETGKFSGSKAKPVSFDDNIQQACTKVNSNTLSNKYLYLSYNKVLIVIF